MLLEQLQQKFHHRLLQDRNHGLGDHMGDRLNPRSSARGQDHRLHRRYSASIRKATISGGLDGHRCFGRHDIWHVQFRQGQLCHSSRLQDPPELDRSMQNTELFQLDLPL